MPLRIRERNADGTLGQLVKVNPKEKTHEELIQEQQELIDQLTILVGDLILKGEVE